MDSAGNQAWRVVGRFGAVLAVVGLSDILLAWYPLQMGVPAWEFTVVDQSFASLPLLTMGLAAMLGSAVALGIRWRVRVIALGLLLLAVALLGAYGLYLLNVPLALKMAPPEVVLGVKKAIVKTSILAVAFSGTYLAACIAALRSTGKAGKNGS